MSFFYGGDDPKMAQRRPMLFFILATLAVGAVASSFSQPAVLSLFARLSHPLITPPAWVFAPVWTALYALMAVAAWRAWRVTGTHSIEMAAYAVQLALNLGWNWLFFGLHRIGAAFNEIVILNLAIALAAILFFRRDRLAGLLFLPYLIWTLYTAFLTHDLGLLNP